MKMYLFSFFSVDDAELALSEKQKKRQIFTGNMLYLTYYWNLKHKNSRFEVSPYTITDHTIEKAEKRADKTDKGRKQAEKSRELAEISVTVIPLPFVQTCKADRISPTPSTRSGCERDVLIPIGQFCSYEVTGRIGIEFYQWQKWGQKTIQKKMQKMEDICTTKDQVFLNGLLWCDQWSVKAV